MGPQMFEWTADLSVGHEALDDDHRAFYFIADTLHDARNTQADKLMIDAAIDLLRTFIAGHFHREEMAMREAHYPSLDAHIADHQRFSKQVRALISQYHDGNTKAAAELGIMTAEWLTAHIRTVDMDYVDWIKAVRIDDRPLGLLASQSYRS